MMQQKFIVVGAGHAGAQLVFSLRERGYQGEIVLMGEEDSLPYQRPPLSKQYLQGEFDEARIVFRPDAYYREKNIVLQLGSGVRTVDREQKKVYLHNGASYAYDKLALATGARVRKLEIPGSQAQGIYYLRRLLDAQRLRAALLTAKRLVICGGGYIGLEVAAVAVSLGLEVTILEMAPRILYRVAPPEIADFYTRLHRAQGVNIHCNSRAIAFEGGATLQAVQCSDGTRLLADVVLVGIGVVPNSELAAAAGLQLREEAIHVDSHCRSSDADIFAAGDCTCHPNQIYARDLRLESVHNALAQAKIAAAGMCGELQTYNETPWFWSDQYKLKLQIAGLHAGYDQVVWRGDAATQAFAAFYLREGRLLAVYAVNSPKEFMLSKSLIAANARPNPIKLADGNVPMQAVCDQAY